MRRICFNVGLGSALSLDMIDGMSMLAISNLLDGFGTPPPLAVLGFLGNHWIAGITASVVGLPGMLWAVRRVRVWRWKHFRWATATGLITGCSVEVRPAGVLGMLRRAQKFARISYRYTYEVNGVEYEGACSVVEDIDVAYDPRFQARRIAADNRLPIRFLEPSPQVSMLNLPVRRKPDRPTNAQRRPVHQWVLITGCACGVLFLLSAWRFASWLNKRQTAGASPTGEAVAVGPNTIGGRKSRYTFSTDKKSSGSSPSSPAPKPQGGKPLADR